MHGLGWISSGRKTTAPGWLAWVIMRCKYVGEWYSRRGHFVPVNELMRIFKQIWETRKHIHDLKKYHSVGYMKRNQIYSFEALHDVMAVYDREFGISFPRIRPKLESWDLRKSHDNKYRLKRKGKKVVKRYFIKWKFFCLDHSETSMESDTKVDGARAVC